ncbi:MAG: LysR substrate-binding domain-containing protein [Janthinobacterium lividum]
MIERAANPVLQAEHHYEDVREQTELTHQNGRCARNESERAGEGARVEQRVVMHHAQSPIMLLSLVGAGPGIATVPLVLKDTAPPGVTFVVVDQPFSELPIVTLFRKDNQNPALRRFVDGLDALSPRHVVFASSTRRRRSHTPTHQPDRRSVVR